MSLVFSGTGLTKGAGRMNGLTSRPPLAAWPCISAACGQESQHAFHCMGPSASGPPDCSVHLRPGQGLVQCHCFLDSSPQLSFFLLSNLGQNNIPPAHQLMQRRSWEEEESGNTFILALGHMALPAAFSHCLYGKCLLIPQTTKGPNL